MLRLVVLVLIFSGMVLALDVDLDCPREVLVDEEFSCDVEVVDSEAKYDLKVDIDGERNSALWIWNGEEFQSGYYYVKDFVRKNEEIKLKISEEGRYDFLVKLRDGDKVEEFEEGRIKVLGREEEEGIAEEGDVQKKEKVSTEYADYADLDEEPQVIMLGGGEDEEVEVEWDYVSRDGMVVDWLPYLLCLFLIFLVGIMGIDKIWNR